MKINQIGYVTLILLDVGIVIIQNFSVVTIYFLDAEEQNVFPLQFNDTVYYMTVKDVEPDTELLGT